MGIQQGQLLWSQGRREALQSLPIRVTKEWVSRAYLQWGVEYANDIELLLKLFLEHTDD